MVVGLLMITFFVNFLVFRRLMGDVMETTNVHFNALHKIDRRLANVEWKRGMEMRESICFWSETKQIMGPPNLKRREFCWLAPRPGSRLPADAEFGVS
ncbi:MAG: hypothetical protein JXM70_18885 [Pirellulales bacterium]|nr:hypothetical protein [Pirellulales bacterium]